MLYGIANIGIVPIYLEASHKSEMISQLLYGEVFGVVERRREWCRICTIIDNYQGWISCNQFLSISERQAKKIVSKIATYSFAESSFVRDKIFDNQKIMIPMGALVSNTSEMNHTFRNKRHSIYKKSKIIEVAFRYLHAPYLWGGRTPFGIDASGFVQMVYRLCGIQLPRDCNQQVKYGETLSFLEECKPGDLAFFDDNEGNIIHVGIILTDNRIIHAHGKVQVDFIDHGGIYNAQSNQYLYQLRVLKHF